MMLAAMLVAASCSDDIVVTTDDFGKYETGKETYGYIQNSTAPADRLVDLYSTGAVRSVEVGMTKSFPYAVDMNIAIDETVLTAYNETNFKNYAMLPPELVNISHSGTVVILPGKHKSDPVTLTISSSADLVKGTTYVIPLRISTDDQGVTLTDAQQQYVFFVIAQGDRPNPAKAAGYKVFSCQETGDGDPRIHLEFSLKNEGKPLFDAVILFSANMNYDASTGKPFIFMNNSIGPILQNRDRYIKPLQDMGIKVLLGLLGNHDAAGVAHLTEATAVDFVKTQLKPAIEAYGLDGVFWDDEYSSANPNIPGFTNPSTANASRLIFETKRAMPDKLNTVYLWSTTRSLNTVDGVLPGEYVDYLLANYGENVSLGQWPGATVKQGMPYPYELALQRTGYPSIVANGGWGGIMVFALSEHRDNWNSYGLPALRNIATTMFGDQLEYTGVSYPVEW